MNLPIFACVIFLLSTDVAFPDSILRSKLLQKRSISKNSNKNDGLLLQRKKPDYYIKGVIEPANCEPENRSTSLRDSDYNPTYQYYPRFVLIEKCGGCCENELMECQNVTSVPLDFHVDVHVPSKKSGELVFVKSRTKVVTIYQDVKCKCGCKTKADDCKAENHQKYNPDSCQCECTNEDEEKDQCQMFNQEWNPATCSCKDRTSN